MHSEFTGKPRAGPRGRWFLECRHVLSWMCESHMIYKTKHLSEQLQNASFKYIIWSSTWLRDIDHYRRLICAPLLDVWRSYELQHQTAFWVAFCPQHGFATSIVVGIHNRCSLAAGGAWGPRIVWVLQHLLLSTRAARWNMYVEKSRKSIFIQTSQSFLQTRRRMPLFYLWGSRSAELYGEAREKLNG